MQVAEDYSVMNFVLIFFTYEFPEIINKIMYKLSRKYVS